MAIRKINEINEVGEINQLSQDVQNTILQALINQGQRVNFAVPNNYEYDTGWDPGYNSFTFKDLLPIVPDSENNIGIIEENDGIYTFSYVLKNKLDEYSQILPNKVEISKLNNFFSEILPSGNRLLSSSNVENIKNLKVLKDSTKMVFSCIGTDANDNDFEFLIEEVDYVTNELLYGLRIIKENVLLPSISLVYIKKNGTKYIENVYKVNKNYDSISNLLNNISDIIEIDSNTSFDNLFENIIYGLLSEFDEYYTNIEVDSIFDIVNPVSVENLGTVTKYFEYDLKYLYRDIKEYIFEKDYSDQNLKLRILASIYDKIQSEGENVSSRIFIPLDYEFNYAYNKVNPWQIYHSVNDIVVNYIYRLNNDISNFDLIDSSKSSALFAISASKGAVKDFTFSVKYDKDNDYTVLGITSNLKYSLPYINEEGKWIINDIETSVNAHGINAGNPNIILLHLYKNGDGEEITEFLTGINKNSDNIGYTLDEVNIEPYSFINKNKTESDPLVDFITVKTPIIDASTINDDNFYLVEKSLLISVTHTDFISNEEQKVKLEKYYGSSGTITSLWSVIKDENTNLYICKPLTKTILNDLGEEKEVAIDFNYLTNVNNVVNYALEGFEQEYPDKYTHSKLLFDGIKNTFKQQSSSNEIEYYIPYVDVVEKNGNKLNFTFNVSTLSYNGESDLYETLNDNEEERKFKNIQDTILQSKERNDFFRESNNPIDEGNGEYSMTFDIPTLDLSTVLTKKETLLNKLDILTLNSSGDLYLSYIGMNLDDENINSTEKSPVFTIGTTDTRDSFRTQSNIDINFNNITLNGETYSNGNITSNESIISNKNIWKKNRVNDISNDYSYQCQYTPLGKYNTQNNVVLYIDNEQYIDEDVINTWKNNIDSLTELFVPISFHDPNISRNLNNQELAGQDIHIYFADGIYIPKLLENLHLENIINITDEFSYKIKFNNNDYNNIIFDNNSNTELYNDIIYINSVPVFLILNSSNLECNYPANQPAELNIKEDKFYTSNQLDILCYQEEDDWIFEINENTNKERYSIPYKLKFNY